MSKTIDERVVSMEFDNSRFEKNVATSMSTLDKLKQKLHLQDSSKGFDNISAAAKKVNMSTLNAAVDTVCSKFSAMDVIGVTALANITNSAVNAGKRIASALTIKPITTGFSEYETQINSTQTILANVSQKGKTLEDVNAALDELNEYADQTIYNFTEMTKNIGLFTNAGVGLDESVAAIKGFSNAAAMAGTDSTRAAGAMYQLSQAMSSGKVQLMDWRSLEQANITGERFQETVKETARAHGIAIDAMIKEEGSLRDTLSSGWLTADLMTEALNHYTLSTETMTEAEQEAARAKMKSNGYTDEQIKKLFELGTEATNAATKVKTFSQMWDVLQESAQSGWTKTWQLIIGDFEGAKNLLTPLANFLTGIIDNISKARNELLEGALLGNPFSKLAERIDKVTGATEKVAEATKNYGDIVDRVIGGEFGNGQERFDKLAKAGYDWAHVQNLVNEKLGCSKRYATDFKEAQEDLGKTQAKTIEDLLKMSDAQLKNLGFTEDEIDAFRELETQSKKTGIPIKDLMEDMDQLSGRSLLINSFKNAGQGLVTIFKSLGEAWREVFPPMTSEQLYNIIAGLHKFSTHLVVGDDTAKKLTRTFKGLFAILDIITTVIGGGFKIGLKILSKILGAFDMDVLDLTANIGDAIVKFRDWLFENNSVIKTVDKLIEKIPGAISAIKEWIDTFFDLPKVQELIEGFKNGASGAFEAGKDIVQGLFDGLTDNPVVEFMKELGEKIINKFKEVLGIHSPSTVFFGFGVNIIQGLVNGIAFAISWIIEKVKWLGSTIASAFTGVDYGGIFEGLGEALSNFKKMTGEFDYSKLLAIIPIAVVLLIVKKIYDVASSLANGIDSLNDVISGFADIEKSFSKVLKSFSMNIKAKALEKIAMSIAILVGSIILLTFIKTDKLYEAIGIIVILAGILVALSFATEKMSKASVGIGKSGASIEGLKSGLVSMGLALLLMATIVKMVGSLNPNQAKQGFIGLIGMMVAMGAFIIAIGKCVKSKEVKNFDKLGTMMRKLAVAMLLMVGVTKLASMLDPNELKRGGIFAAGFAAFVIAITAVTKSSSDHVAKVGSMVKKLATSMLLMIGVIKLVGLLRADELLKGGAFALAFAVFVGLLVKVTTIDKGNQIAKLGGLLLSISTSLLLMIGMCKLVGALSADEMLKGAAFVAGFAVLIFALVQITKIGKDDKMAKLGGTILAMALAIGALAVVATLLSLLPIDMLAKGVGAIAILGAIMSLMLWASSKAEKATGGIIAMTVAIAAITICVASLSAIKADNLIPATVALGALMGVMALLMLASSKMQKVSVAPLLAMSAMLLVVGGIILILTSLISDVKNAIAVASMLGVLMGALVGFSILLGKFGGGVASAAALLVLSTSLIAIAAALLMLAGIPFAQLAGGLGAIAIALLLIVGTAVLLNTFSAGASLLIGLLVALAAVTVVMSVAAVAFAGALYLVGLALPVIANGLTILITSVGSCSEYADNFLVTMLALAAGIAVVGLGAIVAGAGIVVLSVALMVASVAVVVVSAVLVVLAGALAIVSAAAMFFGDALYVVGAGLTRVGEGIQTLVMSVAGCQPYIEAFASAMLTVGASLLAFLVMLAAGLVIFSAGAIVASVGAMLLAAGVILLSVAILMGAMAVLTLAAAFGVLGASLNVVGDAVTAGADLIGGFINGIQSGIKKLEDTVKSIGQKAVNGIKKFLKINSPSKVTQEIGKFFGDGFSDGIDNSSEEVAASAENLGATAQESLDAAGSEGGDAFESSVSENIDLSNVDVGSFDTASLTTMMSGAGGASGTSFMDGLGGEMNFSSVDMSSFGGADMTSMMESFGGAGGTSFMDGLGSGMDLSSIDMSALGGGDITSMMEGLGMDSGLSFGSGMTSGLDSASMTETLSSMLSEASSKEGEFKTAGNNIMKAFIAGIKESAENFKGVFQNLITAFKYVVNSVGTVYFKDQGVQLLEAFKEGLTSDEDATANFLRQIVTSTVNYVNSSGVQYFRRAGNNLMVAVTEGMGSASGSFVRPIQKQMVLANRLILASGNLLFKSSGTKVAEAFKMGFIKNVPSLLPAALMAMTMVIQSIKLKYPSFVECGQILIRKMVDGMKQRSAVLISTVSTMIAKANTAIKTSYLTFYASGAYLGSGLVLGINSKQSAAYAAGYALGQMAAKGEKDGQKSNSPSKLTMQYGKWFGEGLVIGIHKMDDSVYKAGYGIGETATNSLSKAMKKVSDVINLDTDVQPRIRPVLDLSDVKNGAGTISDLFNRRVTVGATANVGAVGVMMNERIQNGENDNVVSAINKLRKDLSNVGNTSYNINGVTYDDGSNITDAVKTLVRAARVERRR